MTVEVTVIKSTAVDPTIIEQITDTMPTWFQQGGVVMWLLLLTSFIVTIITLERISAWVSYLLKKEHFLINDCFAALNKNNKEQALIACLTLDTPALNMLKHGIQSLPFSPQEKMQSYATDQVNLMSHGQAVLRAATVISLMLGLLGGLVGLIDSLNTLSYQSEILLGSILRAISHAMITCASGICISLLAFISYRVLQTQSEKLHAHLQKVSSEFNSICQQKTLVTNNISDIMALRDKRAKQAQETTETVAEQSEMPYHYEFKEGSDEVNVSLHKEMEDLNKTSQSSLIDMYKEELDSLPTKKRKDDKGQSSLAELYGSAVNEESELYGVNEVELQEQQENAHLKKADNL